MQEVLNDRMTLVRFTLRHPIHGIISKLFTQGRRFVNIRRGTVSKCADELSSRTSCLFVQGNGSRVSWAVRLGIRMRSLKLAGGCLEILNVNTVRYKLSNSPSHTKHSV